MERLLMPMLEAIPDCAMVLNSEREILAVNSCLLGLFHLNEPEGTTFSLTLFHVNSSDLIRLHDLQSARRPPEASQGHRRLYAKSHSK
jgi:hypothetical protein